MPNRVSDELDAVLEEHGRSVWRLIVRMLGNDSADAMDCFQQAFVELAQRHRRLNDVRRAGALLKRIAASRAIDVIRKRIRERKTAEDVSKKVPASQRSFEPDVRAEANEFLDCLRRALAELSDSQAEAFVLTQIEGLSNEDAAKAIGVTINHLNVLLHRARAALRDRLESHRPVRKSLP